MAMFSALKKKEGQSALLEGRKPVDSQADTLRCTTGKRIVFSPSCATLPPVQNALPFPSPEQLPAEVAQRLSEGPPINIYRVMVNAPGIFIPWSDCVKAVYASSIPAH